MSQAGQLSERLKQRQEQQLKEIEQITADSLRRLSERLQSHAKTELTTISGAIASQTKQLRQQIEATQSLTVRAWLRPALIAAAITLGAMAASWGGVGLMSSAISSRAAEIERKAVEVRELDQEISRRRSVLQQLPAGVEWSPQGYLIFDSRPPAPVEHEGRHWLTVKPEPQQRGRK